jgi:hypothetical protein
MFLMRLLRQKRIGPHWHPWIAEKFTQFCGCSSNLQPQIPNLRKRIAALSLHAGRRGCDRVCRLWQPKAVIDAAPRGHQDRPCGDCWESSGPLARLRQRHFVTYTVVTHAEFGALVAG